MSTSSNSASLRFCAIFVNPFGHGLAVATRPRASNDDGNLEHKFLLDDLLLATPEPEPRLQEPVESGADAQEHDDPQHRHDESQRQTAREHQDVNEQNVDDDRSEQRQREWDVAIDQEQDRRNDLEQKYRDQIMRNEKRADELAGGSGRRRAGMKWRKPFSPKTRKMRPRRKRAMTVIIFMLVSVV